MKTQLYYHKTSGGAEYLCTKKVKGTDNEGNVRFAVARLDGEIELFRQEEKPVIIKYKIAEQGDGGALNVEAKKGGFKKVNQALYNALLELFNCHVNNGGKLDFAGSNSFDWLCQTLDFIKIKYWKEEPDGDRENEIAKDKTPFLTDEEAYGEMLTRFTNLHELISEIK